MLQAMSPLLSLWGFSRHHADGAPSLHSKHQAPQIPAATHVCQRWEMPLKKNQRLWLMTFVGSSGLGNVTFPSKAKELVCFVLSLNNTELCVWCLF